MQSKVLAFLTFNVSTCIKKDERSNSINRYNRFTHMCRAGFAGCIQLITVFATLGLFLIENLLKIPEIHVVWHCFFNKLNVRVH